MFWRAPIGLQIATSHSRHSAPGTLSLEVSFTGLLGGIAQAPLATESCNCFTSLSNGSSPRSAPRKKVAQVLQDGRFLFR